MIFLGFAAFTITFIILASWLLELIFIVSSIRLNLNGRILFVLMVENGLCSFQRENLIPVGYIRYAVFESLMRVCIDFDLIILCDDDDDDGGE
jgi:hypothetical protein